MTDILRNKLIQKGWVTEFNADTLVCLIEEHYAELAKPVSVSERLPGPEDCDEHGRCWWGYEVDEDCGYCSKWTLLRIRGSATGYPHWLPAHALPLP